MTTHLTAREAEVTAWRTITETVMQHFAAGRAEVSDQLGISFSKARVLRRLTGGPMTMGELTTALATDAPYTSLLVGDLVDRKLAVRTTHPSDRRRKMVALTPAGTQMARRAQHILDRPPPGISGLTDTELEQLAKLFALVAADPKR
jgi:DNA-binding MarR family transcriptional regulator